MKRYCVRTYTSLEKVTGECHQNLFLILFDDDLLTIVDVDALLHGLADEIASVKGVPRIRTINHFP